MNISYWPTSSKIVLALLVAAVIFAASGLRIQSPIPNIVIAGETK